VSKKIVGIIDYGSGNLTSIKKALESIGLKSHISSDSEGLKGSDILLLPGVGAFPSAMEALKKFGLDEFIPNQSRRGVPIIGICLGMQLLAQSSTEIEHTKGLGLIHGEVLRLEDAVWHIGWNEIVITATGNFLQAFNQSNFYFNHSYYLKSKDSNVLGYAELSDQDSCVPALIKKDNIIGIQFHPEKSQTTGQELLRVVVENLCHD
jgi:glutamine amidotransferase